FAGELRRRAPGRARGHHRTAELAAHAAGRGNAPDVDRPPALDLDQDHGGRADGALDGGCTFRRNRGDCGHHDHRHPGQPRPLRHERVRYVGEAVALVVAETLQQARDAAEAVWVEYEELPHVVDLEAATTPGAPVLCDEAPDNVAAEMRIGDAKKAADAFQQ